MSEELEPLPDSQVFVLDSHIPYDLDNIYDGVVVKVVIPESFDLEVSYLAETIVGTFFNSCDFSLVNKNYFIPPSQILIVIS